MNEPLSHATSDRTTGRPIRVRPLSQDRRILSVRHGRGLLRGTGFDRHKNRVAIASTASSVGNNRSAATTVLSAMFGTRRPRRKHGAGTHPRQGAVMVETAIVLSVFLMLLFGTLDLSLAVWHYNTLADAARQGTRAAIVHGEQAPPRRTAWGPATYTGTAADSHEIADAIRPTLVGLDPADVTITVTWPDGGNDANDRVQCAVAMVHEPVLTQLFDGELALSATSVMLIAH